jgi:hypothetical protein
VQQAKTLFNPPKSMPDQELFVWPWMGILANVPVAQTEKGGATVISSYIIADPHGLMLCILLMGKLDLRRIGLDLWMPWHYITTIIT